MFEARRKKVGPKPAVMHQRPEVRTQKLGLTRSQPHHGEIIRGGGVDGRRADRRCNTAEAAEDADLMHEVARMAEPHRPARRRVMLRNQIVQCGIVQCDASVSAELLEKAAELFLRGIMGISIL